ncbi:unnamed protein product [Linum trigynum]|uniref:Uncharacterized protein n=1 Tax=Linum trigynum TaxID=586398 RepID=A0AAV2CSU9_9ROSI
MAKSSAMYFMLALLFFAFSGGAKMTVEAKHCSALWDCSGGDDQCWNECKSRYGGQGLCDLGTAPGVPRQCFCAYEC